MSFHINSQIILGRWLKSESTLKLKNRVNTDEDATSSNEKIKHCLINQNAKIVNSVINVLLDLYTQINRVFSCYETLPNESIQPVKLRPHLQAEHTKHINKPAARFHGRQPEFRAKQKPIQKYATDRDIESAMFASYGVFLPIAKGRQPHTTAQELIPAAAEVIISRILGCTAAKNYNLISL
jgi:hypothetical protein